MIANNLCENRVARPNGSGSRSEQEASQKARNVPGAVRFLSGFLCLRHPARWAGPPIAILCALCGLPFVVFSGEQPTPEQAKFFEMKVRPLLSERCFECHGDHKQKGALRLDSRDAALKGGQTGPAFVPGKAKESLLIAAVGFQDDELQMPPKKQLPPEEIAILTQWIDMGAPWPAGVHLGKKQKAITDADRAFWSFQPLKAVPAPPVDDAEWAQNPIDAFIFAKLKTEGLTPAPLAPKHALVRRAYFDLHGLPPTPEETDAFINDPSPDSYAKLIDTLLASPRYGERWARHWLDLVRYAESDGYRQDAYRANAWPYRDYVIRAFNDDKPYDRFVLEQLAGDELDPANPDVVVATGYLRHGMYEYNQRDAVTQWNNILYDITDVTGDLFLGLSMGCARCHDHKFDPILQEDYFKLLAFFNGILPRNDLPLATPRQIAEHRAAKLKWEEKTTGVREQMAAIEQPHLRQIEKDQTEKFPPEVQVMMRKPVSERTPYEHQLSELAYRQIYDNQANIDGKIKGPDRDRWQKLKRDLAEFDDDLPKPLPEAFIATDFGPDAAPTYIPGDKSRREIKPGLLKVLGDPSVAITSILPKEPWPLAAPGRAPGSTGRRTALAKWITQPDNALTTRVIANRIWQYHFGRGLVATSSDYGKLGEKPTHPELLDHLASEFVKHGWSFKKMHRQIMLSRTYRQSGTRAVPDVAKLKDPDNRWLWKMPVRRLDAEQIRDAMLAVSGELQPAMHGPAVDANQPRRTIYTKVIRNTRDPLLDVFDAPDAFGSTAARNTTTTPTQSLLMINGLWPLQRAEVFAAQLNRAKITSPEKIVEHAFRHAYGRAPQPEERAAALKFLTQQAGLTQKQKEALKGPMLQPMPHVGGQALVVRDGNREDMLRAADNPALPSEDFTIEAIVQLESLYTDAKVRVIAAQWSGNEKHPGWSFGVTSEKSRHQPRNLILQLSGDPAKGGAPYEVIPSDLRVELHKPHYVAVSVKVAETGQLGVTFYMRDLSDNNPPLRAANVKHTVTAHYRSNLALTIGGRENHGWDGLIDRVRISRGALTREQLLINSPDTAAHMLADWTFENQPGVFTDSTGQQPTLTRTAPLQQELKVGSALIDFCHVLLNSNEFLYVE